MIFLSVLASVQLMAQPIASSSQPTQYETGIQTWPATLQTRLDTLMKCELTERTQVGLMVYDLTADMPIFTYNHRQTMRPASTMKVVTAITALDKLGGNYQLTTSLYYSGDIENRTLRGNLYCVGGMDPMFDINDLRDFVYQVKQMGIDTLRGAIVLDRSMKDTLRWGEGWCWDDDNPTLTPLLVGKSDNFVQRFVSELQRGGVYADQPLLFEDRLPLDAIPLAHCRHSIDQLLLRMLKDSDNLYAECLYYHLASSFGYRPARASYARALEKQLVNQLGLDSDCYKFADGSGLSLYNYVSPELLTRLLRYAWRNNEIYSHFMPALPVAGQDGTLKKRMGRTAADGNVRAKTGTLTGIISLAGYATAPNGHELCFAIINQGALGWREARAFQDKVCVTLCKE